MGQSKEIVHAAHFNNAFSGSFLGGDGASLCSTAHPTLAGNKANKPTVDADLSEASLEDELINTRLMTNSRGLKMYFRAKELVVPPQLGFVAERLLKSEKQSGTANNDINVFNRKFKIVTTPFLTDTNNWFLIDSTRMKEFLIWQQRIPMEFAKTNDFDTYVHKWSSYVRFGVQPLHWPWIYGHAVS
jgi:phage major head subunit gpT-like protein